MVFWESECPSRTAGAVQCRRVGNSQAIVTTLPCPDENGIVTFDYSIFEQKLRKPATYNTNDCTLKVEDRGGNEYGVAMNLILVL